jgi:ribonuclease D
MPIEVADHGYRYITKDEELDEVLNVIGDSKVLGIDTESDSLFSYRESCCLIQITGERGPDFIIDPLTVRDLSPLAPLMENPESTKIFHGADFDIVSMKRDFGFRFSNIFDTMIAAQAVGHERFGLFDLASQYFGVTLNKKYQRHDWSSRPLKQEHLDYARLDSHFLPTLMGLLSSEAEERGRTEMLSEEFELLESREWTGRDYQADDCIRIKGASKLTPDQLRVLRAVCSLRDGIASERNRPSFKVWGNDSCLKLASSAPVDRNELRKALGENHHIVRRYAREVIAAVLLGKEDTSNPPAPVRNQKPRVANDLPPFSRDHEKLMTHLRNWRNKTSEEMKLGPGMVVNNTVLKSISALQPHNSEELRRIPEMRRWQIKDWGEALVEQVIAFETARKEKAEAENAEEPRKRKRKRRGRSRGRNGGREQEAGNQPSQNDSEPTEQA